MQEESRREQNTVDSTQNQIPRAGNFSEIIQIGDNFQEQAITPTSADANNSFTGIGDTSIAGLLDGLSPVNRAYGLPQGFAEKALMLEL